MVVIGTLLAAGGVVFWLSRWRGHDLLDNRWFLRFAVIAGPLAVLARRIRLGRHRSRPSTVDGVADTAHQRRRQHEHRPVVELPGRAGHLSRYDRRARTWCCVRWRGGGGPVRPTCRARTGRRARGAGVVTPGDAWWRWRCSSASSSTPCSVAPTSARASTISPPAAAQRGGELRTLVDHSIGPVWEANHVWLIYILVIWWTGLPGRVRRGDDDAVHSADPGAGRESCCAERRFAFRKYAATFAAGPAVRRDLRRRRR